MKIVVFDESLLPPAMERRLEMLTRKLEELNKGILRSQDRICFLRQARDYFNFVLTVYPTLVVQLHASARIIRATFDSGTVKNQKRRESGLATSEKKTLRNKQVACVCEDTKKPVLSLSFILRSNDSEPTDNLYVQPTRTQNT